MNPLQDTEFETLFAKISNLNAKENIEKTTR